MMKKALVIATEPLRLAGVLNLLYEKGFDSIGAVHAIEAKQFFVEHDPELVILLSTGLLRPGGRETEKAGQDDFFTHLETYFLNAKPLISIWRHETGVKGLAEKIEQYEYSRSAGHGG
jgi:hypothetical protein